MADDAKTRSTLALLRKEGLTVDGESEPFTVAGEFLYCPSTDTWRLEGGRRAGYGWRTLAAAARLRRQNRQMNAAR